jgi:hypothetical protein
MAASDRGGGQRQIGNLFVVQTTSNRSTGF